MVSPVCAGMPQGAVETGTNWALPASLAAAALRNTDLGSAGVLEFQEMLQIHYPVRSLNI